MFHSTSNTLFRNEKQFVKGFIYTNYSIEPHDHDFYEINIILNGTGIHNIANAGFRVKTGDVFVIPPMTVHSYTETENLDVYHLTIHHKFISDNKKEAAKVDGFLQLTEIEPFLRKNYSCAMFLHLSPKNLSRLKEELKFIEDGGEFDGDEFVSLKTHSTWKILYWLSHLLHRQLNSDTDSKENGHSRAIISSLDYIHHNYRDKITVNSLAKMAYMSRSTFLRSFYSVCGCTPINYLISYRCTIASELIKEGEMAKTEIAHRCGFYDLSHMERCIKEKNNAK